MTTIDKAALKAKYAAERAKRLRPDGNAPYTASFGYMALLEETGHMPTEKYAHAPEILEHSQRIAIAASALELTSEECPDSGGQRGGATSDRHC